MTGSPAWRARTLCTGLLAYACQTGDAGTTRNQPSASTARPAEVSEPKPAPSASAPTNRGPPATPPANPIDSNAEAQAPCRRLPFFDFYRNARLITLDEPNRVRLQIQIDYHTGAGCMAPDGYGTDLIITLHLQAQDSGCFVERAEVRAVDWGLHQIKGPSAPRDRELRFDFAAFEVLKRVDLTQPDVEAVGVHNASHAVSALVRRTGVLWYEETRADSVLHTRVDTQGEEAGCCWPSTSTRYREFGVYD